MVAGPGRSAEAVEAVERLELPADRTVEARRVRPRSFADDGDEVRARVLVVTDPGPRDRDGLALARRLGAVGVEALCFAPEPAGAQRDDRAALAELEHVCATWETRAGAGAAPLAVVGLGAAGTLAFLFACVSRRPRAVVVVDAPLRYAVLSAARPNQPLELALNLSCPLLALYGTGSVPITESEALAERCARFSLPGDVERVEVERVGLSPEDASSYHEPSARRIVGFLLETSSEPDA